MIKYIWTVYMDYFYWLHGGSAIFTILWALWRSRIRSRPKIKKVCVLVLGDIGRSPRMQYHALSFAKEGLDVDLVGYPGSEPLLELREHAKVKIHYLRPPPDLQRLPRLVRFVIKTLWQSVTLLYKLCKDIRTGTLIVQNPPAVPTLPICWAYAHCSATEFIIDWHNYAHTIMGLTVGKEHILTKMTKHIESFFGCVADRHFCVTEAMRKDLRKWSITAKVLYDRPPEEFKPIDLEEKHLLLTKLSKVYEAFRDEDGGSRFTERLEGGEIRLKASRPGFTISSTSWTEDEDFSILFNALHEYEIAAESEDNNLPDLVCAVTGKGPLKEFWNAIIERKTWQHVKIVTPWLENEDYPKLLASADLGVCLHTSSSGLDLPMKVVDMFGCGLPVCAYQYKCLKELVKHEENSYVFSSEKELAEQIKTWFSKFPVNEEQENIKKKFQRELTKFRELRWHVEARQTVNNRPIIGILTQEIDWKLNQAYPNQYDSYIAASYVKFVEGAGARVVPIWIGKDDAYYEDIISKINGALFPGGSTWFNQTNGYADAGKAIYRIAKKINKGGDYFPIWGTCLGFELLAFVAAKGVDFRDDCSSQRQALPLEFTKDFRESRMFKNAPENIIDMLSKENLTVNFHSYCVTQDGLKRASLANKFRVMSLNKDRNGLQFISSFEHVNQPFYGVQFHPEKNLYEWVKGKSIPHGDHAIKASQYFADFFVNEARKNTHRFENVDEEKKKLIYNYAPTYTSSVKSTFEQCYLFKNPKKRS